MAQGVSDLSIVTELWSATVHTVSTGAESPPSDPDMAHSFFCAMARACLRRQVDIVKYEVHSVRELVSTPFACAPSGFRIWTVEGTQSGGQPLSLVLNDPRAGAAMVGFPGLPWGRGFEVLLRPGVAVLHPSQLPYTILPDTNVRDGFLHVVDITAEEPSSKIERNDNGTEAKPLPKPG